MKSFLSLILLTISVGCFAQQTIFIQPPLTFNVTNGNLSCDFSTLATAASLNTTNNTVTGILNTQNQQAASITALGNQVNGQVNSIAILNGTVTKNTADIVALQAGSGSTIPQSLTVTSSQTIAANFNYNGDIWVNCPSGCTVTIPVTTIKNNHWKLHNTGTGQIKFVYIAGKINSVNSMTANSRPFDITFNGLNVVEVH